MTRAKIILVSVILAAGTFGIFYAVGADEATADTVAEATVAAEESVSVTEDSGDWISTEWYLGEVTETIGQMGDLSDTMAEASFSYADGYLTTAEYVMLADEAVTSVESHIDYFEGVEPPQGFDETNDYLMDALYDMRSGLQYARDGSSYGDPAMIDTGAAYISDAAVEMELAGLSLPTDY